MAQGIHPQTAYKWYRSGNLPVPARKIGQLILVGDLESRKPVQGITAIYARVSSGDQKGDLDGQVARVLAWAGENGYSIDKVVTEVGSALNGRRRKFLSLLMNSEIETILVEHRDRFCRFGTEYIEAALYGQARKLVVVDSAEIDDDLVRDMTEILVSFYARLYGKRGAAHRAEKALQCAKSDAGSTCSSHPRVSM